MLGGIKRLAYSAAGAVLHITLMHRVHDVHRLVTTMAHTVSPPSVIDFRLPPPDGYMRHWVLSALWRTIHSPPQTAYVGIRETLSFYRLHITKLVQPLTRRMQFVCRDVLVSDISPASSRTLCCS